MKYKFKRGDEVEVISGKEKSKKGKVLNVDKKTNRVTVEGLNMLRKTLKRSETNPDGGFIDKEASIHYSNLKKVGS